MTETNVTETEWTLLNYQDGNSMVVQSIAQVTANEARSIRRRFDYIFLRRANEFQLTAANGSDEAGGWAAVVIPIRYIAQWLLNRLNENMPEYTDNIETRNYITEVESALSDDAEGLVSDWNEYNAEPNEWSTFMDEYETENPAGTTENEVTQE